MTQKPWIKFLVVFLYHGFGSVLPLFLSLLEQNPTYLVLIPIVKALWESIEEYLKNKEYLGAGKWH